MAIQFTPPPMPNMMDMLRKKQQGAPPIALPMPYPQTAQDSAPQTPTQPAPAVPSGIPPALPSPATPPESAALTAQLAQMNAPPTTKEALLNAVLAFAPTAIAGAVGGLPAAAGAAQGAQAGLTAQAAGVQQQKKDLLMQVESARGREERMAERQLTTEAQRQASQERLEGLKGTNQTRADIAALSNQVRERISTQADVTKNRGLDITEADKESMAELRSAQVELTNAKVETEKAKNDPNSPAYKAAQARYAQAAQRLSIAERRLGLSEATYDARYKGTDVSGNPLPGAMITEDAQPVGSTFSQNVRPTGQERGRADLADSAKEQVAKMRQIVQKRPEIFGPLKGRKTDITVWLGSQDPDAQAFMTAQAVASEHLAGAFGGVAVATINSIKDATARFKTNPEAAKAALDQVEPSIDLLSKRGTVRTVGSEKGNAILKTPAKPGTAPPAFTLPDGRVVHRQPDGTYQ